MPKGYKALAYLEAETTILARLSWSEDRDFFILRRAADTDNGGDEAQATKTTAKTRTTAKATADFSTAAANAPPSVEMTVLVVLKILRGISWNDLAGLMAIGLFCGGLQDGGGAVEGFG
jgi:hypothetical protein